MSSPHAPASAKPPASASRGRDLISGPVPMTLVLFTLPALASNVLQSLNGVVNAAWIGHYLGEAALTASSNVNMLLFFLLAIAFGMSLANTILVGQAMGAKDPRRAKRTVGTSLTFFSALSVLMALIGFIETPDILSAMHTPGEAQPLAIAYLHVIFIALPFMYLYNFLMMALRGAGDARTPLLFMTLSVGLDIALNPLFIFGWGPVPAMGIAGSALATLIAQVTSLAALIVNLYTSKHVLSIRRHELRYFRIDLAILKALVLKGIPMGLQMMVIASSSLVMIALVNPYGSEVTAAYGAASQLWTYLQMPALAIGASVSAMVAQGIGAGRLDRVNEVNRVGVVFSVVSTTLLVSLLMLFEHSAQKLFLPAENALATAGHINIIVSWNYILLAINVVLLGTVRATGAVFPPLIILAIAMWGVRIPVAYLLQSRYGTEGIWWSFAVGSIVALTLGSLYFRFGNWRQARMLSPGVARAPAAPRRA